MVIANQGAIIDTADDGLVPTNLRDRAKNVANLLADQLVFAVKSTDDFVHSSPWQAVGAGALVGLAAGMLLSRGSQRVSRAGWNEYGDEHAVD